jgi:hypothetical protein
VELQPSCNTVTHKLGKIIFGFVRFDVYRCHTRG